MPHGSHADNARRALQAEFDRALNTVDARAARILRIQTLYYPEFLARHPAGALPIPPLVVGRRHEWERRYRAWRDAVLLALRDDY